MVLSSFIKLSLCFFVGFLCSYLLFGVDSRIVNKHSDFVCHDCLDELSIEDEVMIEVLNGEIERLKQLVEGVSLRGDECEGRSQLVTHKEKALPAFDCEKHVEKETEVFKREIADYKNYIHKRKSEDIKKLLMGAAEGGAAISTLLNKYESEEVDANWSVYQKNRLDDIFYDDARFTNVSVSSSQCKSSMCKVSIMYSDDEQVGEVMAVVGQLSDKDIGYVEYVSQVDSESGLVDFYFARNLNSFSDQ